VSGKNQSVLEAMRLVESISAGLNTTSWIWGGFAVDIQQGCFLREHRDLDYLTLNLHTLVREFAEGFEDAGWQSRRLGNGDLKLEREGIKIQLGHVEILGFAKWTHDGERGYVSFPEGWLSSRPFRFCDVEVHAIEPEFQWVLLEHPEMLNPEWKLRDKDIRAKEQLGKILADRGVDPHALRGHVTDTRM
jgi:hypothetical protein